MSSDSDGLLSASTAAAYVAERLRGVAGLPLDPAAPHAAPALPAPGL